MVLRFRANSAMARSMTSCGRSGFGFFKAGLRVGPGLLLPESPLPDEPPTRKEGLIKNRWPFPRGDPGTMDDRLFDERIFGIIVTRIYVHWVNLCLVYSWILCAIKTNHAGDIGAFDLSFIIHDAPPAPWAYLTPTNPCAPLACGQAMRLSSHSRTAHLGNKTRKRHYKNR